MVNSTGRGFSGGRGFVQCAHPDTASSGPSSPAPNPNAREATMPTRHLFSSAALALAFCVPGAFAADACRTLVNGIQKCDVTTGQERSRDDVVAEIHARADTSTGCRTIANGVQKCDVPTGRERSREDVVTDLKGGAGYRIEGCRTIANGVQKCDLPTPYQRGNDTAVAGAPAAPKQ